MDFIKNVRMLLLAAWLGAAIYFSVAVAPSVFAVLRSFGVTNTGEIAGSIVTRTLSVVNVSGFLLSLLLLVSAFALKKILPRASFLLQMILLAIIATTTAVGEWVIAAKMRGLRLTMQGQIDQLPLTDPNRMAFAALHGYSVAALGVAMIAGLAAVIVMAKRFKSN